MRMVSALNMLSRTACTSLSVMLTFARSASVTPENLARARGGGAQGSAGTRGRAAGGGAAPPKTYRVL